MCFITAEAVTAQQSGISAKHRDIRQSRAAFSPWVSPWVSRHFLPLSQRSLEGRAGVARGHTWCVCLSVCPRASLHTLFSKQAGEPERAGWEQRVHSHGAALGKRCLCAALTSGLREAEKAVFMFSLMLFIAASQL